MPATWTFKNSTKGTCLATQAKMAKSFFARLKGLLGTKNLSEGHGLFLHPCSSIHMFGMAYAIDAIFVDKKGTVVGCVENIKPGRMSKIYGKADSCLEVPPGSIARSSTTPGDVLEWSSNS